MLKNSTKGLGAIASVMMSKSSDNPQPKSTWASTIESQVTKGDLSESINIQAIPCEYVAIDDSNARELKIEPADITTNIDTLRLPPSAFDEDGNDWFDGYRATVSSVFSDEGKANDFLEIATFAAALKSAKNLMAPIVVTRVETSFRLIAGERRFLAHLLLEEKEIAAKIWMDKLSELQRKLLQWAENHDRKNLNLYETLKNMKQILAAWKKENPGQEVSRRRFSTMMSISKTQSQLYQTVISAGDELLDMAIKDGRISNLEIAYELATMDSSLRQNLIRSVDAGKSITQQMVANARNLGARSGTKKKRESFNIKSKKVEEPVRLIVKTMMKSLKSERLEKDLSNFDLNKHKDVIAAFEALIKHLSGDGK